MAKQDNRMIELIIELNEIRPNNAIINDAYRYYTNSRSQTVFSSLVLLLAVAIIIWFATWFTPSTSALPTNTNSTIQPLYINTSSQENCMPLSNPPLSVGSRGQICLAKGATLAMRESAGGENNNILEDGTSFTVVGGPECAYYDFTEQIFPWWEVETSDGKHGWLVDGGDITDPVYLCRVEDSVKTLQSISSAAEKTVRSYWDLWGSSQTCQRAWDGLSNTFKEDNDAADYLQACRTNKVQITEIIDLDQSRSDSLIEVIGQCVLLRMNSNYSGEMTLGLLWTNQQSHPFKIHFARFEHNAARLRANEIC